MTSTDNKRTSPYDFIPTPERTSEDDLGDRVPTGHHRLASDFYSGTLQVEMVTTTEVLVPDAYIEVEDDHVTKSTRRDQAGKPLIPATSVKGMLRSAYEAVTNSRLGVLDKEKVKKNKKELSEAHQPALKLEKLSPADRVFGWVSEAGADNALSSYMGQLSVGPIAFKSGDGILNSKRTLKVLSSPLPKPSALKHYANGSKIKGRKIYPHHRDWKVAAATTHLRQKNNQTFDDVIPAGVTFTFQISLRNVSPTELGALLFVLEPRQSGNDSSQSSQKTANDFQHRLGGGKPLGFGSVQLKVTTCEVAVGEEWIRALSELRDPTWTKSEDIDRLKADFTHNLKKSADAIREKFLAAGAGKPTSELQYPTPQRRPNRGPHSKPK